MREKSNKKVMTVGEFINTYASKTYKHTVVYFINIIIFE